MRYLKSYKIFESLESDYEEIIADLEDMSVDVQDLGVGVEIWSEKLEDRIVSTTPIPESYNNAVQIHLKELNKTALEEIKYFMKRAIEYMQEWDFKYFGSKNFKVYEFDLEELEKSDFYDIYVRFYKPENTYHVVSYRSNNWKIIEADLESLESAKEWINQNILFHLMWLNTKLKTKVKLKREREGDHITIISDEEYWEALGKPNYFS